MINFIGLGQAKTVTYFFFPGHRWDAEVGMHSYNDHLEYLVRADELGFDGVCVTKHHYTHFGLPWPNLVAAALAVKTSHAKLVLMGNCLPLHPHPVRLAKEPGDDRRFIRWLARFRDASRGFHRVVQPEEVERYRQAACTERSFYYKKGKAAGAKFMTDILASGKPPSLDRLIENGMAIVGGPETVTKQIKYKQEQFRAGTVMIYSPFGALPIEMATRSMELFAREVLPNLRAAVPA